MSTPLGVTIQGFSSFERATFDSFFRLSMRRTPAYRMAPSLELCGLVIADADNPGAMAAVAAAGKLGVALTIGVTPHEGAAMRLARPINLMSIVKMLDQMALQVAAPLSQPERPSAPAPAPAWVPAAVPATAPAPAASTRPTLLVVPTPPQALPPKAAPVAEPWSDAGGVMDHILVVDDSDIALRFMAGTLERFGFVVHLARSGEEAIERTLTRHFAFVFMDVNMPGLDGFRTCKEIKRRRYEEGQRPPTIVMLTSRDTPIDKLRGTMAGSDAYLTKPLAEAELLKVIGDREVSQHAFAETAKAEDLRF
jgi:two-component system, cell cycle response regulator